MSEEMIKTIDLKNGEAVAVSDLAPVSMDEFRNCIFKKVEDGARLSAMFAKPSDDKYRIFAVLSDDSQGMLRLLSTEAKDSYPSLTPNCPQAHLFEREMYELHELRPVGHPWLKPVRFLPDDPGMGGTENRRPEIGRTDYFQVLGEEVHEVAVGPVHAGVIEPGHFRFQCHGERVFTLEISLGYQHRGIERTLLGGPGARTIHYMETLAGDTSIGHATAYCQAVETLSNCQVPPKALAIRGIMLELERLANHVGDLGALALDVGYLPTSSFNGALRGDFLNITAMACGNRFGRGMVIPGGVVWDMDEKLAAEILGRVEKAGELTKESVDLLWSSPSVMARFQSTGEVSLETCRDIGMVGPAARACGNCIDVRENHRFGYVGESPKAAFNCSTGDVYARAYVRWLEVEQSLEFIKQHLKNMPDGPIAVDCGIMQADKMALSLMEGWRGEICHCAITDENGKFSTYKVVDPSFHNWFGLALALREQEISDFPLCNKSFNLSYCGFDL